MNSKGITYLAGKEQLQPYCTAVCEAIVCHFLKDLGQALKEDGDIQNKTAASAFAFWCRSANLEALRQRYSPNRMGRGLIFHIAPANLPFFFLYTLAVGLLSGNSNIIRLSEQMFDDDRVACRILNRILSEGCYHSLKQRISILTYSKKETAWTEDLSWGCNGRIVWGGDASVAALRQIPLPPYAVEYCFPHRVSLSILDEGQVGCLGRIDLDELARRFCNDTYAMDQLACSSPRLVLWLGAQNPYVRKGFWDAVSRQALDFGAEAAFNTMMRYTGACRFATTHHLVQRIYLETVGVCRLELSEALPKWEQGTLAFGTFLEANLPYLDLLYQWDTPRLQTISFFGIEPSEVINTIRQNGMIGGSRVIPIGAALDFDVTWDGVDLVEVLSRIVGER